MIIGIKIGVSGKREREKYDKICWYYNYLKLINFISCFSRGRKRLLIY